MTLPYSSPSFIGKWTNWIQYRREIKKPYKSEQSIIQQLAWFIKQGYNDEEACEAIDQAIRCGWQGIHPIKNNLNNGQQQPSNNNHPKPTGGRMAGTYSLFDDAATEYAKRNATNS